MRYQSLTPAQWCEEMIAAATAAGRADSTGAAHLSAQSVALREHSTHLVTVDIQRLTGRPAVTLKEFVERNRQSFEPRRGS